jgi:hypothetical protein
MGKLQTLVAVARGGGGTSDPDRLQLSVAINAAAEARSAVDKAAAARGRIIRMCDEAEDRLASATAGVAAAKDALARRLTNHATDGDGTVLSPDSELRNARAEEQSCTDGLDAARAALAACEAALEGPIEALKLAERRRDEAATAVLSRHIEAAVSDVVRLKASLFDALSVLHFLQAEVIPQWPPNSELSRVRSVLQIDGRNGVVWEIDYEKANRAAASWSRYAKELKTSADAEPPSI